MLEFHSSPAAKAAGLPFSQAVRVGDVLYLVGRAGQSTGQDGTGAGRHRSRDAADHGEHRRVLKPHGLTFDDIFKCTVMLADMKQWGAFNKIYLEYFKPDRLPIRSAFGAAALASGGGGVGGMGLGGKK